MLIMHVIFSMLHENLDTMVMEIVKMLHKPTDLEIQ